MTWNQIETKYKKDRRDMTPEEEKEFVNDCFGAYEEQGFKQTFQTPYEQYKNKNGKSFEVIRRCNDTDCDLCVLPMWKIRFQDGTVADAYPEEIICS